MKISKYCFFLIIPMTISCNLLKKNADTLLYNGKIFLVDERGSFASAMAIKDGRVMAVGETEELRRNYAAGHEVNLEGKTVYPGFIDAHCHLYGLALSLQWVDLRGAGSFDEVIRRMQERAEQQPDGWLIGRGWDHNLWPGKQFPDRARLDQLFPGRPVVLMRIDGHSLLANRKALEAAGIDTLRRFPAGEVATVNGQLTGILSENAADYMRSIIPGPERQELSELLNRAQEICFRNGLTGVTDAGLDRETVELIDLMHQNGTLKIHVSAMLNPTRENIDYYITKGPYQTDRLHVSSIKLYADGSLGSRTALLKQPYSDDSSVKGIQAASIDSLKKVCALAYRHGYQVNTHCIGDSAVKMMLNIYAGFLKGKNDRRWKIEHAQVVDPADMHLFGDFSIIPSVQATHATSDMYWAVDRLGPERIKGAYAYKQLLEQNGWIPNGTDFPIEQVSPILTFYAAVTRKDLNGFPENGFQPENALSREEALRSVTIWAAMSDFDEKDMGSLQKGKWADFIVTDQDIMTIPWSEIPRTKIREVFVHGEKVFSVPVSR